MSVRSMGLWLVIAISAFGCAGSGPTQAEGPKPSLEPGPAGANDVEVFDAIDDLERKDFPTAKKKAEAALAKNPKHAQAHFVLAVVAEEEKDPKTAIAEYKAALAADPALFGASVNLSNVLIEEKQFDEAADVARAGLKHAKAAPDLHINLAWALAGKGDHASAAKSLGNAILLKPEDPVLRLDQAQEFLEAGDKDAAAKAFKNAAAKAKGEVEILAVAGAGLAQAGDAAGCVAAYDQVVEKQPKARYFLQRAICKHKAGDLEGARADANKALELEPSPNAHFAAAKYAEEAKDKKSCKQHYLEAAKLAAAAKPGSELEAAAKKGAERCK